MIPMDGEHPSYASDPTHPLARHRIESTIERLIALLDSLDADPDLEEDGSDEPWLGWTPHGNTGSGNDFHNLDVEQDLADAASF